MGGRGGGSPGSTVYLTAAQLEALPYNVIGSTDRSGGGATYPFLEQTGRAWHILTRPLFQTAAYHAGHTFHMEKPTLRWVNDNQVTDLYVDGMDTEQFLTATGLEPDLHKGGYVFSKRLSRIMRPHFVSGRFAAEDVTITYLEQDEREQKVWDGAGLVSRRMLEKMVLSEELSPARRQKLERELQYTRRVEFTIMTAAGQDKGHAIVADHLPTDFVLPQDTKREVRLNPSTSSGGDTFVGFSFVHGHDDMRLDVQSLINLHPFFDQEQLADWLHQEGEVFTQSVENGTAAEAMGRVDRHTTIEDVTGWPLREYLVSGGDPRWFGSHVKSLMNQHLKRLNYQTLQKLRLPIPGGRFYVMPEAVGRAAGLDSLTVPRGHIRIDGEYSTAWVNDDDWVSLPDSPERPGSPQGIAGILGGADHDDALWVHPFTDHDGRRQVLAWRSPNQVGEYVVLQPTTDSHPLDWATPEAEAVRYPAGDSRKLPPRIDRVEVDYLNLVDPFTAGGLGEGADYSVEVMDAAVERALANQGALGMYCNSLMVNKALFDRLPEAPPAPLEDIIDSAVKTGADLSRVVAWNYGDTRRILESGTPIPELLHGRLSIDRTDENRPPRPIPTRHSGDSHWLDETETAIKEHIAAITAKRDELVQSATPPRELFDSVFAQPETIQMGAGLNQTYARTLKQLARKRPLGFLTPEDHDRARRAVEDYLAHYPLEQHTAILRGAMVSAHMAHQMGDSVGGDTAVWLPGEKTAEGRLPGIGHKSIQALREIGLLDEIDQTEDGLLVYPNAAPERAGYKTVGIRGVWWHWHRAQLQADDQLLPAQMKEVGRKESKAVKRRIEELAQTRFREMTLHIKEENGSKQAYTTQGNLFGTISRDSDNEFQEGDTFRLKYALSHDGNLRAVVEGGKDEG